MSMLTGKPESGRGPTPEPRVRPGHGGHEREVRALSPARTPQISSREHLAEALRRRRDWGADYVWALRSIRRGFTRASRPPSYSEGALSPVLLVPGVLEDWTMMLPVAERLSAAGHPIHVLPELRRNTVGVVKAASLGHAYLETEGLREVVVVAHSKGGLIGKQMLIDDADARIRRLVAIATPFHGSQLARMVPTPSIWPLRPSDPTILALAERPDLNERIVSIYPAFDPHIPGGSSLEGAVNVPLEVMGHFQIMSQPEVLDAVVGAAEA